MEVANQAQNMLLVAPLSLPIEAYYKRIHPNMDIEVSFVHAHTANACHFERQRKDSIGLQKHLFVSRTDSALKGQRQLSISFAYLSTNDDVQILRSFDIQEKHP